MVFESLGYKRIDLSTKKQELLKGKATPQSHGPSTPIIS